MKHRPESAGAVERDRALKKIRRLAIKERWPKAEIIALDTIEQLSCTRFGEFRCSKSIIHLLSSVAAESWCNLRHRLLQLGFIIEVRAAGPRRAGVYRIETRKDDLALTASLQTR